MKVFRPLITGIVFALLLPSTVPAQEIFKIVAFGDSITQGYPYLTEPPQGARVGGYEPYLEGILAARGRPSFVYNQGWGGEGTFTGLSRLNAILPIYPELHYVLLLEGTNDLTNHTSPESIVFNLSVMVDLVQARGAVPVLGTITPDVRSHRLYKEISETNALIRALAVKRGIPLCDLYAIMAGGWAGWSDDGLHPNLAGYATMAQAWYSCLPPPPPPPEPVILDITPAIDLLLE